MATQGAEGEQESEHPGPGGIGSRYNIERVQAPASDGERRQCYADGTARTGDEMAGAGAVLRGDGMGCRQRGLGVRSEGRRGRGHARRVTRDDRIVRR